MSSIEKYFNGEKAESYVFIVIGMVALLIAFYFVFTLKTSFWRGVAIPFILVAMLEFIIGYTIVKRSPKDIYRVESFIKVQPSKITLDEIPRMKKVMKNFVIFRYVEICLILLGIILMYSSLNDTLWRGIGLGLFMQAFLQRDVGIFI